MDTSGDTLVVNLTTYAYGGEVLGRLPDGRAVFVPFAIPGEIVRIRLVEEKRGYARAELIEVLEASPLRINPVCAHFLVCGGCHYQHMPYEAQLLAKTEILRDQLERIGKLTSPPLNPAVPSPSEYYYRNHVQFHLTPEGKLGYHKARSDRVFAIKECHLPEEALNTLWPLLDLAPLPGLGRISLRLGVGEDILVSIKSGHPMPPELTVEDLPVSVVYLSPENVQVLAGSNHLFIEVLGRQFRVTAGSFFQVNAPMAAAMVEHLLENLPLGPQTTALDVYAGVGLFSAFLAPRVDRLLAVESSLLAGEDFVYNLDEFENVELYQASAEETLPLLGERPQVVVVDPPRAGLDRQVVDALLAMQPDVLAYVSCDPATLARDARRLVSGGYYPRSITLFDLFPQTYHIESISLWLRTD